MDGPKEEILSYASSRNYDKDWLRQIQNTIRVLVVDTESMAGVGGKGRLSLFQKFPYTKMGLVPSITN